MARSGLPVIQWSLHQFFLNSEIFEAVLELGVGHVDGELLQNIRLFGVKIESQVFQPLEVLVVVDLDRNKNIKSHNKC